MPNWLVDKIERQQQATQFSVGAVRQARRIDPNNIAASLETQTSGLGVKSAQKKIAQAITFATQQGAAKKVVPTTPTTGTGQPSSSQKSAKAVLISQKTKTAIIGGEKVIVLISTWVFPNSGKTFTKTEIIDFL